MLSKTGRMTYETLNGAIDEYNNAVAKKYTFLGKGFQAMASIKEKKRFKVKRPERLRLIL